MPRPNPRDADDWETQGLDPDGPSPDDLERFGHETVPCLNCHADIYDQAEVCPHCGHAQLRGRRPLPLGTIAILVALALIGVTAALIGLRLL